MEEIRSLIGRKLRDLRKARRWSQAELAAELGVTQARLSRVENGQSSLSAEQFILVLKLFNVGPSDFLPPERDPAVELHNALVRHGAVHLQQSADVVPSARLDQISEVVREALALGEPRSVTALAPVLVLHINEVNLPALRAKLANVGLEHRFNWLLDNTEQALREALQSTLPRPWSRTYRRALLVLETHLELLQRAGEPPAAVRDAPKPSEILDHHIRTAATLAGAWSAASPISRRWGIGTSLQPRDFVEALRAARESS
jgi:transcriptional regulator with XRE-family HTH domain